MSLVLSYFITPLACRGAVGFAVSDVFGLVLRHVRSEHVEVPSYDSKTQSTKIIGFGHEMCHAGPFVILGASSVLQWLES